MAGPGFNAEITSPMKLLRLALTLFSVSVYAADEMSAAHGGLKPDELAFFEKHIRPVLVNQCYQCHSATEKIKGGLALDTKAGTLAGGESGHPAVVPGRVDESALFEAISWTNEDMQMPPKQKLPADVVAAFKKWIEMGAPDPREGTTQGGGKREIDIAEGRKHWAFSKPVKPAPPVTKESSWARTDLDRFVLAGLEAQNLKPVSDADRQTLIRRISYDLTGLPPTPDEVRSFLADRSPDAVERVVDGYLDSERFGERWARHWLDIARYGESSGKEVNVLYAHAWRYRDYVIESFKKDKPYDLFLKEQIAGDLMKSRDKRDQAEKIVATGFLAIGPKAHNERDRRQFMLDMADEQIDVMSQAMLGVTISCARCHDHKFDPITQRDYYALAGIFLSTETLYGTYSQLQNIHPSTLIELDDDAGLPASLANISPAEVAILKQRKEQAERTADAAIENARAQGMSRSDPVASFVRLRNLRSQAEARESDLDLFRDDGTPRTLAMGTLDRDRPLDSPLLIRGEVSQPGQVVPRGLVEVLCAEGEPLKISEGSGRLDLAYWIASRENPLTARVMVNRVWLKLFGKGIVETPDNFGVMGVKPTNQPLLDHLAVSFMENGWSVKSLIKEIMMSRSYQLSAANSAANEAVDPENRYTWRMTPRRLDAEAIRDGMLAVAGVLNLYPVDGSPVARAGEGREGLLRLLGEINNSPQTSRSIYLPIVRDQIPEMLTLFDFPDASLVTGDRDSTNVPSQSLFLMNSAQVIGLADAFAKRIAAYEGGDSERISYAFQLAYGRDHTAVEGQAIRQFFADFIKKQSTRTSPEQARNAALSAFAQSLLASAEFRYLN
jgi:hypothetical protein